MVLLLLLLLLLASRCTSRSAGSSLLMPPTRRPDASLTTSISGRTLLRPRLRRRADPRRKLKSF